MIKTLVASNILFEPLRQYAAFLDGDEIPRPEALDTLGRALRPRLASGGGMPLRFVPAKSGQPYEATIYERGEVPTRPGDWHDFFNALAWLRFPRTKAALNRRHYGELARERAEGRRNRSRARDTATLFDESGALVASADASLDRLLRAREWEELFWARRADVLRSMRFHIFGHALYDKLRAPYVGLCAKLVFVTVEPGFLDLPLDVRLERLDAEVAARWDDPARFRTPAELANLPLLGIPGVTPASECAAYYADRRQFRPKPAEA